MRRGFAALGSFFLLAGCGSSSSPSTARDAGASPDASGTDAAADTGVADATADTGVDGATAGACAPSAFDAAPYNLDAAGGDAAALIGSPCIPAAEGSATFDGFSYQVVSIGPIPASGEPTCLVDHFRGLVTCPYGQSATGQAPACALPCTTPSGEPVTGAVQPQCANRRAAQTVVWSCRCANAQGATNDGDAYCTCPTGTTCTQTITGIGAAEDDFSGAYCIPNAAIPGDAGITCPIACNPQTSPCP